ncbi:MAG: hypothetical protein LBU65_05850 [Planctomycetaceae bacterium]|nr:hypothetical protein [Planctomycetaceae bacterium]
MLATTSRLGAISNRDKYINIRQTKPALFEHSRSQFVNGCDSETLQRRVIT